MMQTTAYDTGKGYLLSAHLDTTKTLEDGSPDPEWVQNFEYGYDAAETPAAFVAQYVPEVEALAALDPRLQPAPQPLPL